MRDKLINILCAFDGIDKSCGFRTRDCKPCEELADYLIANGVTFADDNNVGDKEMVRHLFNRCAAITQCGLCFCCSYQKECESARDVFAKDGEA